jgi:precorrin-8X/cobalt-precorrin-8 methylmutase
VPIVTDVRMVAAGFNKKSIEALGIEVHCFIDDPTVARLALERGVTRSLCAMTLAAIQLGEAIYVVGNAPTALTALCIEVERGKARPRLVMAMPVGFVNVVESKTNALAMALPCIAVEGRKGGSALAAAAMNALMEMALEGDEP